MEGATAGEAVVATGDRLDGAGVRRWCLLARDRLAAAADELNRLNVYPVRDADTGVNMASTLTELCAGLPDTGDAAAMLAAAARAAMVGARGNSGTILSQLFLVLHEGLPGRPAPPDGLDAAALAAGLDHGVALAYRAVAAPVEGTMLSVAKAAAGAASVAAPRGLGAVVSEAVEAARAAVARTPEQLPVLAAAGVVDAGGKGWCLVLEALETVVTGATRPPSPGAAATGRPGRGTPAPPATGVPPCDDGAGSAFGYEVEYLLEATPEAVDALRDRLAELGDSLVVVGGGDSWRVHVHVDDVGAAVEAGVEAGRPHRIRVTRFADQQMAGAARRVVAVVTGPGMAALARAAGAVPVIGAPDGGLAVEELTRAILDCHSVEVVLMPHHERAVQEAGAAVVAARDAGCAVSVLPVRSPVQALAALAVHDPARAFADDVIAMSAAAGATRVGAVVAHDGALVGLVGDEPVTSGGDLFVVATGVLDRLLIGGGDLVTLLAGAGLDDASSYFSRLSAYVGATRAAVEVQGHVGGQPAPLLLVGVE